MASFDTKIFFIYFEFFISTTDLFLSYATELNISKLFKRNKNALLR